MVIIKQVTIYTDGGCRNNHLSENIGAYAYYLECENHSKHYAKGHKNTTNNQMELLGAIEALKVLKFPCEVKLHSDSAYMVNAINQNWIHDWANNGWKRKQGNQLKELKNVELWKELYSLIHKHKVTFIKVKGHSNCELNNFVDKILNEEMDKMEDKR